MRLLTRCGARTLGWVRFAWPVHRSRVDGLTPRFVPYIRLEADISEKHGEFNLEQAVEMPVHAYVTCLACIEPGFGSG